MHGIRLQSTVMLKISLLTLYDKFKILVFKWLQKKVNGGKNEEANRHCPLTQKSAKTLFTDVAVHVWKDG